MRALASITLLTLALALAACGGGKSEKDVKVTLDKAFHGSIRSASVKLDAQISLKGLKGFDRPIRIQATGPYAASEGTIPKVDLDITAGSPEAGQTIQAGLLSTGDRAFVKFGSGYYEEPQATVARTNAKLRAQAGKRGRSAFAGLGLDPRDWIVDAQSHGDATVGGVAVERFSGKLDLQTMFTDLNKVVERSSDVVGGAAPSVPKPLSPADIAKLARVVKSPSFEIYVGKSDGLVRRVSGALDLTVPAAQQARFNGLSGGSLKFSLELDGVNKAQDIVAPRDVRPISDLAKALGGIGALSGADALGGDGTQTGTSTTPGPTGTSTTPDAQQQLKAYSDCLDKAQPSDIKALGRCKALLK